MDVASFRDRIDVESEGIHMIRAAGLRRVLPLLVLAGTGTAQASTGFGDAGTVLTTFAWEGAVPTGDLKTTNLVDPFDPLGLAGDVRFLVGTHVTLGFGVAWNHFASGDNYATVNAYAPRLLAHWYVSRSRVQPYLGVGAGAVAIKTETANAPSQTTWGASVDPQLGLLITVVDELALDLHVRYSYTTASTKDVQHCQWLAVGVGVGFY